MAAKYLNSTKSWRQQAERLGTESLVFYFASKHRRVRWYARLFAVCIAAYVLSPIQLIPNYIPVIGFLDDVLVLFVGVKLLRRIVPPDVLAECRELAETARIRRKEESRSPLGVVGLVAIASLWLLTAVTASALIVAFFRR